MTGGTQNCHKCGMPWPGGKSQPGFKEICDGCGAYLHCCKNCRHHLPSAHNQCYIPNTEWVGDRIGLNFCEEFEFSTTQEKRENSSTTKNAWDGLFSENAPPDEEKPGSFDDLFKRE